jgi:DNA-binding NarL/FixJ family response regulator
VGETDEITLPRVHQRPRTIGHIHAEPAARRFPRVDTAALAGMAEGLGTAEIARRLNYSERTIKSIIHNMLNRMNLRNRSHAVAFALRNGLL